MREILSWTRRESLIFVLVGTLPLVLNRFVVELPTVPWSPLALLGTAVAFLTGFKSNAAYGRLWEARQIWGGIVNASRTWAVEVRDFIAPEAEGEPLAATQRLVYRHLAWLTALRYQLREPRPWETTRLRYNIEYREKTYVVLEHSGRLEAELAALLDPADLSHVLSKKNRASALAALQSADLRGCADAGRLTELRHVELARLIATFYELQGKCERIKNFPYPRQYATLNRVFVCLFIVLLPFGLLSEFRRLGEAWTWLAAPMTLVVAWVFHTMDKIGEASENPFEGGPNDVPISAMSRSIEIDLRDLANETNLPEPYQAVRNILM